jgi:GNAT superfamily N-acetyltransferase
MNDSAASVRFDVVPPGSALADEVLRRYFEDVVSRFHRRPSTAEEVHSAMAEDPSDDLILPGGTLIVAVADGAVVGCGGLRLLTDDLAELTRVFVVAIARRRGLGTQIVDELERVARINGRSAIRLDTRRDLIEARQLYSRLGYREVPPFNRSPYADHYFSKRLT